MNSFIQLLLPGVTLLLTFLIYVNPKNVNVKGNKWLGLFMFCFFILTIEQSLKIAKIDISKNFINEIISIQAFIIAPVFYISICFFINPNRKWQKKDNFHFAFVTLYILFLIYIVFFLTENSKVQINKNSIFFTIISLIFIVFFGLQFIVYCFLSYLKLAKHQKSILVFSSTRENVDLKWLEYIVIGAVIIGLIYSFDNLFELHTADFVVVNLIYLAGIFVIAYYAMKQKEIYPFTTSQKEEVMDIVKESFIQTDLKKKLLSDEKLEEFKSELISLMIIEKPFLDTELSIIKLAEQMKISTHLLSYLINNGFNENFYQFVNRYRVEEAKQKLINESMNHLSLIGIAYEVGFNSKTVFFKTFKKNTGLTPMEFKINNLNVVPIDKSELLEKI
jgi:AraC-like DNA-binding protein